MLNQMAVQLLNGGQNSEPLTKWWFEFWRSDRFGSFEYPTSLLFRSTVNYLCNRWKVYKSYRTTSMPKSVPHLVLDKVRLLFSSAMFCSSQSCSNLKFPMFIRVAVELWEWEERGESVSVTILTLLVLRKEREII